MGAASLQVTVDCASPHVLADWWAETLGWCVERPDEEFIRSLLDKGLISTEDTVTHNGALVFASAAAIAPADPGASGQVRLYFQLVPEPKQVKNRIHFDVRPDKAADLETFHAQLRTRGATEVGRGAQGAHLWVTYADPEGNEFCVDM